MWKFGGRNYLIVLLTALYPGMVIGQGAMRMPVQAVQEEAVRELSVGDEVPDFEFRDVINYPQRNIRLSDFQGKFIILDFWGTTCSSCIYNFHKLDSLQEQFKGQLQVILVNESDEPERILRFFEKRKGQYALPSTRKDTMLRNIFKHETIPHYVWLDENRVVKAITASDQVTAANLQALLNGENVKFRTKNDYLPFDKNKPLFVDGNGGKLDTKYHSIITGYAEGLTPTSIKTVRNESGLYTRLYTINSSILSLYKDVYQAYLPPGYILLEVQDPSKLQDADNWDEWKYDNAYCYELTTPPVTLDSLYASVKVDLNRFFGLYAAFEKRVKKCYVLTVKDSTKIPFTKGGESGTNLSEMGAKNRFVQNLDASSFAATLGKVLSVPVIDETSLNQNIDIQHLPADINNIFVLQKVLNQYGLDLKESEREIEVFVISDKKGSGENVTARF